MNLEANPPVTTWVRIEARVVVPATRNEIELLALEINAEADLTLDYDDFCNSGDVNDENPDGFDAQDFAYEVLMARLDSTAADRAVHYIEIEEIPHEAGDF